MLPLDEYVHTVECRAIGRSLTRSSSSPALSGSDSVYVASKTRFESQTGCSHFERRLMHAVSEWIPQWSPAARTFSAAAAISSNPPGNAAGFTVYSPSMSVQLELRWMVEKPPRLTNEIQ